MRSLDIKDSSLATAPASASTADSSAISARQAWSKNPSLPLSGVNTCSQRQRAARNSSSSDTVCFSSDDQMLRPAADRPAWPAASSAAVKRRKPRHLKRHKTVTSIEPLSVFPDSLSRKHGSLSAVDSARLTQSVPFHRQSFPNLRLPDDGSQAHLYDNSDSSSTDSEIARLFNHPRHSRRRGGTEKAFQETNGEAVRSKDSGFISWNSRSHEASARWENFPLPVALPNGPQHSSEQWGAGAALQEPLYDNLRPLQSSSRHQQPNFAAANQKMPPQTARRDRDFGHFLLPDRPLRYLNRCGPSDVDAVRHQSGNNSSLIDMSSSFSTAHFPSAAQSALFAAQPSSHRTPLVIANSSSFHSSNTNDQLGLKSASEQMGRAWVSDVAGVRTEQAVEGEAAAERAEVACGRTDEARWRARPDRFAAANDGRLMRSCGEADKQASVEAHARGLHANASAACQQSARSSLSLPDNGLRSFINGNNLSQVAHSPDETSRWCPTIGAAANSADAQAALAYNCSRHTMHQPPDDACVGRCAHMRNHEPFAAFQDRRSLPHRDSQWPPDLALPSISFSQPTVRRAFSLHVPHNMSSHHVNDLFCGHQYNDVADLAPAPGHADCYMHDNNERDDSSVASWCFVQPSNSQNCSQNGFSGIPSHYAYEPRLADYAATHGLFFESARMREGAPSYENGRLEQKGNSSVGFRNCLTTQLTMGGYRRDLEGHQAPERRPFNVVETNSNSPQLAEVALQSLLPADNVIRQSTSDNQNIFNPDYPSSCADRTKQRINFVKRSYEQQINRYMEKLKTLHELEQEIIQDAQRLPAEVLAEASSQFDTHKGAAEDASGLNSRCSVASDFSALAKQYSRYLSPSEASLDLITSQGIGRHPTSKEPAKGIPNGSHWRSSPCAAVPSGESDGYPRATLATSSPCDSAKATSKNQPPFDCQSPQTSNNVQAMNRKRAQRQKMLRRMQPSNGADLFKNYLPDPAPLGDTQASSDAAAEPLGRTYSAEEADMAFDDVLCDFQKTCSQLSRRSDGIRDDIKDSSSAKTAKTANYMLDWLRREHFQDDARPLPAGIAQSKIMERPQIHRSKTAYTNPDRQSPSDSPDSFARLSAPCPPLSPARSRSQHPKSTRLPHCAFDQQPPLATAGHFSQPRIHDYETFTFQRSTLAKDDPQMSTTDDGETTSEQEQAHHPKGVCKLIAKFEKLNGSWTKTHQMVKLSNFTDSVSLTTDPVNRSGRHESRLVLQNRLSMPEIRSSYQWSEQDLDIGLDANANEIVVTTLDLKRPSALYIVNDKGANIDNSARADNGSWPADVVRRSPKKTREVANASQSTVAGDNMAGLRLSSEPVSAAIRKAASSDNIARAAGADSTGDAQVAQTNGDGLLCFPHKRRHSLVMLRIESFEQKSKQSAHIYTQEASSSPVAASS